MGLPEPFARRDMKLFVALGPGDIVAAHRAQMRGEPVLSETSIIFSGQLFEYCRERGIETLALSRHLRTDRLSDGPLRLENRPRLFERAGGILYHLGNIAYAVYLAVRARLFGANLAIIDFGSTHPFALTLFRWLGISVAVNFHNTLWPAKHAPEAATTRLLLRFNAYFFRRFAVAAMGVSPECGRQVKQLAGRALPYFEYRGQFRREGFNLPRREYGLDPFRVAYVGRVEMSKGALDIPLIAEQALKRSNRPIVFEVCGDGGALSALKCMVGEKNLGEAVQIHGRLSRPDLLQVYRRMHALVVPTRTDFAEGFALVCAEAVLAGVPIITNSVVPAFEVLREACIEAETGNIASYVDAVLTLSGNPVLYARLVNACPRLAQQFYDRSQSYPAAVDRLLAYIFPDWKLSACYEPLFDRIP
jgi:glycosyltransferase involved in cell wall biosynthesis